MNLGTFAVIAAAAGGDYMAPLTGIKVIGLALLGGAGAFYGVKGVWAFAEAWNDNNPQGMSAAIKQLITAAICIGGAAILGILGF